jgi:hypothetical protein
VQQVGQVEGQRRLELEDEPVGRVEGADLPLGVQREAEAELILPKGEPALGECLVEEDGPGVVDLGHVEVPEPRPADPADACGQRGSQEARQEDHRYGRRRRQPGRDRSRAADAVPARQRERLHRRADDRRAAHASDQGERPPHGARDTGTRPGYPLRSTHDGR